MVTRIEMMNDICAGKHDGNEQSREANTKSMSNRDAQRAAVLRLIIENNGLSMKEVAQLMGVEFNTVSGRGSELKKMGLVEPTGEVRSGSAVLKATFHE
jgi:predicted transcriptional regulator